MKEPFGARAAVNGDDPDLPGPKECHAVALRGHRWEVSIREEDRSPTAERDAPDLDRRRDRQRSGVDGDRIVPVGPVVAAADVDDPTAISGYRDAGQFLTVVVRVVSQATSGILRPLGYVDVAFAFLVERPSDAGAASRGHEFVRERIRADVRQTVLGVLSRQGKREQQEGQQRGNV